MRSIRFVAGALSFASTIKQTHSFIPAKTESQTSILSMALSTSSSSIGPRDLRALMQDASRQIQHRDNGDLHGIVWMEHLNLVVGCMDTAKAFYEGFLGLTVDTGNTKHFNLGQQQFHLAANDDSPQRITGSICLTVPCLDNIKQRAEQGRTALKGTQFSIHEYDNDKLMTVTCPWGNTFHLFDISIDDEIAVDLDAQPPSPHKMVNLHREGGAYGSHRMAVRGSPGIRAVEIACKKGTVDKIAQFYETHLGCTVIKSNSMEHQAISVSVGPGVQIAFIENDVITNEHFEMMNGVHLCIYVASFKNVYDTLQPKGLIWTNPRFTHLDSCDTWEEAVASRTLRFRDILDVDTSEKVLELEHETRPMTHGQYLKVPNYIPN